MIKFDHLKERGPVRNVRKMVNDLREEVRALRIANGKNYSVRRTALGQILEIKAGKAAQAQPSDIEIKWGYVESLSSATINCNIDGVSYAVNKPKHCNYLYNLLQPDQDNVQYSDDYNERSYVMYTTDDDGNNVINHVTEWIRPAYEVGEYIICIRGIGGWASGAPDSAWHDMNQNARHWEIKPVPTQVCVNGETEYSAVQRAITSTEYDNG